MNPKVSVIITTYQRVAQVQVTIASALAQTFSDFEILVIDDGSTDGTGKVLGEVFGDRIRYFFQTNKGLSAALNHGLEQARGEWVAILDSDDIWERDKLEWQMKAVDQFASCCGACYTDVRFLNHPETKTLFQLAEASYRHKEAMGVNAEVLRLLIRPGGAGMVVCPSSFMGRADVMRRAGGFDVNLRFGMDSDFLFRLAMLTGFCYVNRPLVWFDRSPVQTRHVGVSQEWDRLEFVLQQSQIRLEKFLASSAALPSTTRNLIRETLASVQSGLANCYLESRQYRRAREAISKAVRLHMTFNIAVKWVLTWIYPDLALRTVKRHLEARNDSTGIV